MPRIAHHVTQRGSWRLETVSGEVDYQAYLDLMPEPCAAARVAVWADTKVLDSEPFDGGDEAGR